jgi:hypothetical protein
MHGHGVMTFPDGHTHEGNWDADEFLGAVQSHKRTLLRALAGHKAMKNKYRFNFANLLPQP